MTSINSLNLVKFKLIRRKRFSFYGVRSAIAQKQQRHGPFGRLLQKLSYIRDKRLDVLETFKKQHKALLDVHRDSLVLVTADLQRTLQAFLEFRSHVNKMVTTWSYKKNTSKEKFKKKLKHPIVKTLQTALFRASIKTKVLVFIRFDSCPCFVEGKLGKKISLSWISTVHI